MIWGTSSFPPLLQSLCLPWSRIKSTTHLYQSERNFRSEAAYSTEINHNSLGNMLNSVAPPAPPFLCKGCISQVQSLSLWLSLDYSYYTWFSPVKSTPIHATTPLLPVKGHGKNYKVVRQTFVATRHSSTPMLENIVSIRGRGRERERVRNNTAAAFHDCLKCTSKLLRASQVQLGILP